MIGRETSLKHLFTAEDIAEPLVSVTSNEIEKMKEYFNKNHYDVIGFKENGRVFGFLDVNMVDFTNPAASMTKFDISDLITKNTNLMDCLRLLKTKNHLFVINKSQIESIVTISDIQKPAVRMLFFGAVTFFESKIGNLIHEMYPNDEWKQHLTNNRIEKAMNTYSELIKKNQEINLINCTQFSDKTDIILKDKGLLYDFNKMSKTKADQFFSKIKKFRDDLAHAQSLAIWFEEEDVITLVVDLINITEIVIEKDNNLSRRIEINI
ncbi:hypothetical protein [Paenisporosarcina sp. TG20]|uniref:hypothetical protein n=1 Tax=Paenisporosarcina sp. TG20 TaxID=1211706 RepID=UPI0002EA73F4|nr:hypothetical protein [Paenisporosarcina sp. TG20]